MEKLGFGNGFKFPFNRAKGMLNILWILVPILGIFAVLGYTIRIVKGFTEGHFKELPLFAFFEDLKLGFFMAIKSIPFMIAYIIFVAILMRISGTIYEPGALYHIITTLISIFVLPILYVNFFKKQTVGALFEFNIIKHVFMNIGDYIVAVLKEIALAIVFAAMIIVLVGIPASMFGRNIFLGDFYRRHVK